MNQQHDYRFRNELGQDQYEILSKQEVIEHLQVIADGSGDPVEKRAAKERLLNSYTRLIYTMVVRETHSTGIDVEDYTDIYNSVANLVFQDMTKIAGASLEQNFTFATAVIQRTHGKIVNKIRAATAAKRGHGKKQQEPEDQNLGDLLMTEQTPLNNLLMAELASSVKEAINQLDDVEQHIVMATHGLEAGQGLSIGEASAAINLTRQDGKNAWERAKRQLANSCDPNALKTK